MKSRWIFLSPHLDDAVLSCGGMIWEQVRAGSRVEIWTICAGNPPAGPRTPFAASLEERWQVGTDPAASRRAEDQAACDRLGAQAVHFDLPDCIYRRLPDGSPLVNGEEDLWQPLPAGEQLLVEKLTGQIAARLPRRCCLAVPLSLGNHIDHRLVRAAALRLGRAIHFYADFPYAAHADVDLQPYIDKNWQRERFDVSNTALEVWQDAITCYDSQISSLWSGLEDMYDSLTQYFNQGGGKFLWRRPE